MQTSYSRAGVTLVLRTKILAPFLIVFSGMIAPALAEATQDSESCRQITAALMNGNVDMAVAALNPKASEQAETRESLVRLNYALIGLVKGKTPRLERTLPDIDVENHQASLQIWSFGDREVYLVGCLPFRERGKMYFDLQLRNSVDDIRHHMNLKLKQIRA
ncbi:putative membrane protein [Microvirga lupini]|uniref:Putative membrane protein n=1 Tax=Microvirga lupini TaxID=420324 RepID=A0A7W4VKN9_9HYPH|nr:hypothetical protein [Microvirga lupini]MBB3018332.1 putative membrane protein [Microvirga lupini]